MLEHRKRLHDHSGQISPVKASQSSELHLGGVQSKSSVPMQDPPAQPRRPAPTLPPDKDKKEKKKESTKRRPAPAAPAAASKQPDEMKGLYWPLFKNYQIFWMSIHLVLVTF